MNGHKK